VFGTGRNAVEDLTGLHLAAPRLAGSAAHPVAPGAHEQRRRSRRPRIPAHAMIALSDQRSDPSEEHAPCNKAAIARLLVQAARRQLSACQACTCVIAAGSECARGPLRQHAAPAGARRQAGGTERVISPAHYLGALRGEVPLEGVAGDSAAAPAQGKAFPSRSKPRYIRHIKRHKKLSLSQLNGVFSAFTTGTKSGIKLAWISRAWNPWCPRRRQRNSKTKSSG
jgi:hypothetical protein